MRRLTILLTVTALGLAACNGDAGEPVTDEPAVETTVEDAEPAPGDTEDSADGGEDAASPLTFVGTDDVAWQETQKSAQAGTVEATIECGSAVGHALAIEGIQEGQALTECDAGGSGSTTVELDAGEYTYFCTVPGHREAGMEGTLTVG